MALRPLDRYHMRMKGLVILLVAISTLASTSAQNADSKQSKASASRTYTAADVQRSLDRAEQFRSDGKYEQALKEHIWYHKNALRYDPAQYGVRLSFALSDWAELGQVYPPALHALRSIRNETLTTYTKNPSESLMFGEVMSIDLALNDWQSVKSLFYQGRKNGVSDDILMLHLDQILQTGDLKWASDIVGDPAKKLDEIKRERDVSLSALSSRKDLANGVDGMFASQIATLLKTTAKIHGLPAARKLQKQALKFLDTSEIRNALNAS